MSQADHHSNNSLWPEQIEYRSDRSEDNVTIQPAVGDDIEIFWPNDNAFYISMVAKVMDNAAYVIAYNDGDIERLEISNEQ